MKQLIVPRGNEFELRIASAYVMFDYLAYYQDTITFHSISGAFMVRREGKKFVLDFP